MNDDAVLHLYTVYHRPTDLPGVEYAVREFTVRSGQPPTAGELMGVAGTLERARDLVPRRADACLPRSAEDPANVVETWI